MRGFQSGRIPHPITSKLKDYNLKLDHFWAQRCSFGSERRAVALTRPEGQEQESGLSGTKCGGGGHKVNYLFYMCLMKK